MVVFRLVRKGRIELTGEGARRYGGRWNSVEVPLVYTASTRGTALAEVAVHFLADMVPDYVLLEIQGPDDVNLYDRVERLPSASDPALAERETRKTGDAFAQAGRYLGLWVPSVVVHGEWNLLLNPRHPAMGQVGISRQSLFPIDPQLLRRF